MAISPEMKKLDRAVRLGKELSGPYLRFLIDALQAHEMNSQQTAARPLAVTGIEEAGS